MTTHKITLGRIEASIKHRNRAALKLLDDEDLFDRVLDEVWEDPDVRAAYSLGGNDEMAKKGLKRDIRTRLRSLQMEIG